MSNLILKSAEEAVSAVSQLTQPQSLAFMQNAASLIAQTFRTKNKLLIAGNGGSLCDAMHFAEELTGYFRKARPALPALALTDPGHITCVGNDAGFDTIFARAVEAHGQINDCLVVLTTSGNSQNILLAVETAKQNGLKTIAFLGKSGGSIRGLCDLEWIVDGMSTSDRIQEAHMAAIHIIIESVEQLLFSSQSISAARSCTI